MMSNNICVYRDLSLADMTKFNLKDNVQNVVVVTEPDNGGAEGGSEGGNEGGQDSGH